MKPPIHERAYLAGLIDGEGSIQARWRPKAQSYETIVSVSNTDRAMIDWIRERWPGHVLVNRHVSGPSHHKDVLVWRVQSARAVAVIEDVVEFLITKRERADVLLALAATTRQPGRRGYTPEEHAARQAMCDRMRVLNRRGVG